MAKKILVIYSSFRTNGNSNTLADALAEGAGEAGNEVTKVYLKDKELKFCMGCLACQKTQKCVIADDAVAITEQMRQSDVIVFATPVYYYSVAGQLKTLLDRANSLYPSQYAFRDIYLIVSSAEDDPHAVEGARKAIEGWIECFEHARLAGVVHGGGLDAPGDAAKRADLMDQARSMGSAIQ